jgi:hypothetical protein
MSASDSTNRQIEAAVRGHQRPQGAMQAAVWGRELPLSLVLRIPLLDAEALKDAPCECYQAINALFLRPIGRSPDHVDVCVGSLAPFRRCSRYVGFEPRCGNLGATLQVADEPSPNTVRRALLFPHVQTNKSATIMKIPACAASQQIGRTPGGAKA